MEASRLIVLLAWLFTIFFIFPLTINYMAGQYPINPEVRFFTVMLISFFVVALAVYLWFKHRA
ncbi:MAG: hypothetical protein QW702_02735 [Candidatus Bathyarchaeia archaeon]